MTLPDPRRYGGPSPNALAQLAAREGDDASLRAAVAECIAARRDDEIARAYAAAVSRAQHLRLWEAVSAAVDAPLPDAQVVTRVFAIPWVMVCAARTAASIPCVLENVQALAEVLEARGALGANRNVGFANSLCAVEELGRLAPSTIRDWSTTAAGARECPPAPIALSPGVETVHLRFLLGAAVAPVHEPGVVETAANIGLWGMQATRAMSAQLAMPGVDVLPLPRPPANLVKAGYAGRRAVLEAALNLFLSNTVRRFRLKVGDPTIIVSTHESNEVRITLCALLDEGMTEGFRWPLHPLDDLDEIEGIIAGFARESRVSAVEILQYTLPDRTATGAMCFPTFELIGARNPPQH
jgi:hypothetical protein